jgi:pimeloyl-ACP methyl ester carboxylesterase
VGDPVLVLLGGPGDSPGARLAALARAHQALNERRSLVLVDQRGTGASSPLQCEVGSDDDLQSYLTEFLPAERVSACLSALRASVDLARYRTRDFVEDLEDLRRALDVAQWNLHGTSYGTRVALHYLARHPRRVRSAILHGVVPPELVMPVSFGADADRALAMLVSDCRAEAACAAAFPRLAAELDSVAARLSHGAVATHVAHPVTGVRTPVTLSRGTFGEMIRAAMYTPTGARDLPLTVHEAYGGDYGAIATAALRRQRNISRAGWIGLYLAVTCVEDIARADRAATTGANRATILSDARARQHFAACEGYPARPDGEEWPEGRITAPVLMLVGAQDPVTPPRWAEVALTRVPNGRLVVIRQGGHGFAGLQGVDCVAALQQAFVERPEAGALDTSCLATVRRPPFTLRR